MDLSSDDGGCWQTYPDTVVCRHCETKYETRHINEIETMEGDEDEDE
jgi:rubredoxin